MMSTEAEKSSAVIGGKLGKSTTADGEQSINTKQRSGVSIPFGDSRDDLFTDDPDNDQHEIEKTEIKTDANGSAAAHNEVLPADTRKVTELWQAILELRVYTCKLKGTNRHLQRQNELVKEENTSLINTVRRLEKDGSSLQEENEQLRMELELLKKGKLDTTMSTIPSSHDDDVVANDDEESRENDLVPVSLTIDPEMEYVPKNDFADDDVEDEEESTKLTNKPRVTLTPDSPLMKLNDALYCDIGELKITVTNDEDEEDDDIDNLRMELGKCREECEELQTDLKMIAQDYWKQREDMKVYQFRIDELQIENKELQHLKRVEAEVDAMWAVVKKMDNVNDNVTLSLARLDRQRK